MSRTRDDVRYRAVAPLGSGGMASVTLAEDTLLGRRVALKRVHAASDPRGLTRLRREALVGASLNHPNLVSVYDVRADEDGDLVIIMQYVAGDTLRDLIHRRGALPGHEALRILEGVAAGLEAIHARGIVHRDVKPANILLGTDGAVKLADLGIAAVADRTRITTSGAVVGTFSYMAPEQLEGRPSATTIDIYALAAVAFEMLCGQKARPEPNPLALAHALSTRPPPDLRERWAQAPAAAAAVLQRGMASDPAQRPRTACELVRRLRAALDPHTTDPGPPASADRGPREKAPTPIHGARRASPAPAARQPGRRPDGRAPVQLRALALQRDRPPNVRRGASARAALAAEHGRGRRHGNRIGPVVGALSALLLVAVAVAALVSGGGAGSSRSKRATSVQGPRAAPHGLQALPPRGRSTESSASSAATAAATARGGGGSAAGEGTAAAAANSSGAATPSVAVQTFYADAAHHDYAAAWRLADANMRSELAGYASFRAQMSTVRSISFHRARTLAGGSASSATVAVQTTSVSTARTQQCAGAARTVQAPGGLWMLDGISITCTPP